MDVIDKPVQLDATGEFRVNIWSPDEASLAEAMSHAVAFAEAARRQGFNVTLAEILAKLAASHTIINFLTPEGVRAGFGSLLEPAGVNFGQGGEATLIYASGVIVEKQFSRRGIFKRFIRAASSKADIVLAHTQSPTILAAFRKLFPAVWPSEERTRLRPAFETVVADYLERSGRPRNFDSVKGKVSDLYPRSLYSRQTQVAGSELAGGDGVLIIGFKTVELYAEAVEPASGPKAMVHAAAARGRVRKGDEGLLHSLVVGAGHAGRDMHIPCVLKGAARSPEHTYSGRVGLVERDPSVKTTADVPRFNSLAEADFDPARTVVHVTTGPADRVAVVTEAARLGFKSFILEKPLATCLSDIARLTELVREYALKTVVCFPWLSTPLTRRLKGIIDSGEHGKLSQLVMIQTKSRLGRKGEASGHDTAFEIETPHQVSLALYLAGRNAMLCDASCKSSVTEKGVTSFMGGASLLLSHGTAISNLRSDLECPSRERRIELTFDEGWRCIGWYPASGENGWQVLRQYTRSGRLWREEHLPDDPLTSLFLEAYRYFAGRGPAPAATLELAVDTASLISKAKSACGIEVESLEALTLGGGR